MSPSGTPPEGEWRAALAYALIGQIRTEAELRDVTDVDELLIELGGAVAVARHRREQRQDAQPWPHSVPPSIQNDCGPAQFQAVLVRAVDLVTAADRASPRPVVSSRALSADEIRLLREVPPHHA